MSSGRERVWGIGLYEQEQRRERSEDSSPDDKDAKVAEGVGHIRRRPPGYGATSKAPAVAEAMAWQARGTKKALVHG